MLTPRHSLCTVAVGSALFAMAAGPIDAAQDRPVALHVDAAELPPVIVRPDDDDMIYESDRRLRQIIRGLPEGEAADDLHFGHWLWRSLGLAGATIQDAHPADQQRAADLLHRLEAPAPRSP